MTFSVEQNFLYDSCLVKFRRRTTQLRDIIKKKKILRITIRQAFWVTTRNSLRKGAREFLFDNADRF